jgi:acetyl-CoA synthetase
MRASDNAARYATIHKDPASFAVPPNLADYRAVCAAFNWEAARKGLGGLPQGKGLNIAYEAADRHAYGPRADRTARNAIDRIRSENDPYFLECRTYRFRAHSMFDAQF